MFTQWKWVLWLKLLSDLNTSSDKKTSENKKKGGLSVKSGMPDLGPNKTWLIRAFAICTIVAIVWMIFGFGGATHIDVDSLECATDGKLKIKSSSKTGGRYLEFGDFKDRDANTTYAELVGPDDVFKIFTVNKEGKKYSFRTKRSKDQKNGRWVYEFGKCTFSKDFVPTAGSNCSCSGANGCCANSAGDSSCCTGNCAEGQNKCACCELAKWVDFAIVNQVALNRVTPLSVFLSLLPTFLYLSVVVFGARIFMKGQGMGPGGSGIFGIGNSLSKTVKSKVTFDDVAGIDEVKVELEEVVDYLKNPSKYSVMGAKGPKGVVLYGPPGTGKTLLAKAVSGEASVPFIEASGSSFDDMFVGVGAKRVRELFAKARKLSPCIIFIDEIDAVAGKRGNKYVGGGGGGIADQTINQLLSEMDGFNTSMGVVVIAATNRLDSLDDAILRPGRFDRQIRVNLPDLLGRKAILLVHSRNKNISSSVSLDDLARRTPGFSGAQLESLLNEATLMAVREDKKVVGNRHIDEALDRIIAGVAKKNNLISFNEKKQIAYHESGHAIAGLYSKGGEVVEKVTIIPRGKAAGYMLSFPEKQESLIMRKDELLSTVVTTLAGRAAEEIFFGEDKVSSGASNDLYKVTNLVRNMVTRFGMSKELGLTQYEPSEGMENPYRKSYSDKSSEKIDQEINRIISDQYEIAKQIILDNKKEFLLIAEALLLIETIDRKQIEYIHKHKKLPKEALEMKDKFVNEKDDWTS